MKPCAYTPQVLARHLDGDVAAFFGELSPLELTEHLSDCGSCQRDLQRARRLDAALAAHAGLQLQPAATEALLALCVRAIEQVDAERRPAPPPTPPRFALRLAGTAAGITAAFALAQLWLRPASCDATASTTVAARPAVPVETAPPVARVPPPPLFTAPLFSAPLFTAPLPKSRGPASVLRPARTRAEVQVLGDLLQNGVEPAGTAPRSPFAAAVELRLQAASFLLDGGRADAADAWIAAAASLDAGPLLRGLLADGRQRPQLLQRLSHLLRAATDDGRTAQCLTVAARLGDRELDAGIARLLRRQPEWIDSVAAALRLDLPRPRRAALLLSVWADLVARGGGDDDDTAMRLFAQQPPACTSELLALLDAAAAPERRRICLSLGVLGDVQAQDRLLAVVDNGGRDEAIAAAWAIGRMPAAANAHLQAAAEASTSAWLLRAALTQAGLPVSKQWLAALDLTTAERALIGGGPLSLQQFTVTAPLFRDRLHQGQ